MPKTDDYTEVYVPIRKGFYGLLTIGAMRGKPRILYDNMVRANANRAVNEYIVVKFGSKYDRDRAVKIARKHSCTLWSAPASKLKKEEKDNAKEAVKSKLFDDWLWNDEHYAAMSGCDDTAMAIPYNYQPVGYRGEEDEET